MTKSQYRFKYQRYMTNQEVRNMVLSNPAVYGDPKDENSDAYKILESLVEDSN